MIIFAFDISKYSPLKSGACFLQNFYITILTIGESTLAVIEGSDDLLNPAEDEVEIGELFHFKHV